MDTRDAKYVFQKASDRVVGERLLSIASSWGFLFSLISPDSVSLKFFIMEVKKWNEKLLQKRFINK